MAKKKAKEEGAIPGVPEGLLAASRYFQDLQTCIDFMVAVRWPKGVTCPRCGSKEVTYLENARVWKCRTKHTHQKFSAKVGTIFEDSPLSLSKWLPVVWMVANCKNGVSSMEIHRGLDVTQKTAWFMLHRVRLAMQTGTFMKMGGGGGVVEADETYIGGKARNMHKADKKRKLEGGRGGAGKELVMGLLDRETGKVKLSHIVGRDRETIHAEVRESVYKGSKLYTDELASYTGLEPDYVHEFVNHAEEYVRGNVHTNGMENFWSLLKRGLKGTYISVEPFHLFRYLDEQAFRYNERKHTDGDRGRFIQLMTQITGKRVQYKELTGKTRDESAAQAPASAS